MGDVSLRTFEGRSWRWIVTNLKTGRVLTSLTPIATEISTSRVLAGAWPAAVSVPSDDPRVNTVHEQFDDPDQDEPFVARAIRALVGFRDTGVDPLWECAFAGPIFQVTDTVTDGTVPSTQVSAWDCRKYLERLPLVDGDGDLPGGDGIAFTAEKANVIARAALQNWIDANPGCLASILFDLSAGLDEDCAELTMTFQRGTTIADVWSALEQTGAIDIVLDPTFDYDRPGVLSVVNFEVEHGTARPASIFSWDRSPRSLPTITRMEDALKLANTIQDYTDAVEPVAQATDPDSIAKFGEWWSMRAWPGQPDEDAVAAFAVEELVFMRAGQTTLSMTPAAARSAQPVQDYDIGDRVPTYASPRLRKPIAGRSRIYQVPFTIGDDARELVSELVVSADAVSG